MTGRREVGGSRYLYDSFDAAHARIDANERVAEERWAALERRLGHIDKALDRLERRLWLTVYGVATIVLSQLLPQILAGFGP
jgi:predicted lysophospholipase L1 biosynthesis ABC-type transport system permease subunit